MQHRGGKRRPFGSSAEFGEAAHGLAAHLLGSLTRPHLDPWSDAVLAVAVFDPTEETTAAMPRLYLRHRTPTFGVPWIRAEWSTHLHHEELSGFLDRLGSRRGTHLLWLHLHRWRTPEHSAILTDITVRFTGARWLQPESLDNPSVVAAVADRVAEGRTDDKVVFTYTFAPPWLFPPSRRDG